MAASPRCTQRCKPIGDIMIFVCFFDVYPVLILSNDHLSNDQWIACQLLLKVLVFREYSNPYRSTTTDLKVS